MTYYTPEALHNDPVLFARQFGWDRVERVMKHRERRQNFFWRQIELLCLSGWFLFCAVVCRFQEAPAEVLFVCVAVWIARMGELETRRMRVCGRDYRCKHSMEVMGI